ncbi:YlmH family RNA-binding protein [Weissella bombi]|uniref:RNA-binding protein YlmH, contains S4-like domain n=1 Tax=Weissella bombi TaxID=1505725 RepID=A0A1C3ZZK7_9LACO|nr:YlmH/Sll1252 family protein [Weissella bombi]SCB87716.1 RNA-binding protein YlmH, contains S4-like domain [Weissella bombi]
MVDNVAQHFRPNETTFLNLAEGLVRQVLDEYRPVLTNFLNPREIYIVKTLVNQQDDLKTFEFGGYSGAENKRLLIAPSYYQPDMDDFELMLIQIKYPEKFTVLHHSTILGTFMHNGIARQSIGDIIKGESEKWYFSTTKTMGTFILSHLDRIGKTKVRFQEVAENDMTVLDDEWVIINTTVSSLRLDSIVANGYNISRSHAKEMIEHDLIKVNWATINKPDYVLAVNDLVSVRHYGRLKLDELNGLTKKDKWRLTMAVIKK